MENKINPEVIYLMPNDRELLTQLLKAREFIDVIIPRGGKSLIDFVVENSKVPVIETGANCSYIHR